jgi:serine/threonine protein kinase
MAIRPAQNVIQLFGVCADALDGKLRIVMELCTHGSLRNYVKSLSASEVCDLLCIYIFLVRARVQHIAMTELSCRCLVLCEQWSADKATDVFLQLACGVKHLHACGVLHRDLKTDNALIQSIAPLVVKWADFGVSVKLDVDSTYGDGMPMLCPACRLSSASVLTCFPGTVQKSTCTRC